MRVGRLLVVVIRISKMGDPSLTSLTLVWYLKHIVREREKERKRETPTQFLFESANLCRQNGISLASPQLEAWHARRESCRHDIHYLIRLFLLLFSCPFHTIMISRWLEIILHLIPIILVFFHDLLDTHDLQIIHTAICYGNNGTL